MARQTLRQATLLIASGDIALIRAAHALDGCPIGGWAETQQARRRMLEELPSRAARSYTLTEFTDAVYTVDTADRYRALTDEQIRERIAACGEELEAWSRRHPETRAHGAWDRVSRG
jgi:hypothetical protein